jgi:hypothetical protein
MIDDLRKKGAPLWHEYLEASQRAESQAGVLRDSGDYPLLGGGDVNLYSLFVERAETLVAKDGLVALLTPSGIAADKGAAEFFRSISSTGRLGALFDFENKGVFFPDVHDNFKFVALVFGGQNRTFTEARLAFYLRRLAELGDPARVMSLSPQDFQRVNPNTGAAPIFRNRRDADITLDLYRRHQVLVRHGRDNASRDALDDIKVWPVKYQTIFHMTNDSHLFLTAEELTNQGYTRTSLNQWEKDGSRALPLLVGKTIWHYDHRASGVEVNLANVQVAASSVAISAADHQNFHFVRSRSIGCAKTRLKRAVRGQSPFAISRTRRTSAPPSQLSFPTASRVILCRCFFHKVPKRKHQRRTGHLFYWQTSTALHSTM